MKIIVTGGAGFIGSNLVDKLIENGHNVTVIDNLSTGKRENLNPKCTLIEVDLVTVPMDVLDVIMSDTKYVFHVAAKARVQPSIADPIAFNEHNVDATLRLLDSARRAKTVKRFIFSSSSSVYGGDKLPFEETMPTNPLSPYALQKLIGEQYCQLYSRIYGLETVCLRYFSVYGNRQPTQGAYCTILGIFTSQHMAGEPLTITNDGEQKRDFTHVSDVVDANILAMEHNLNTPFNGMTYNIGNGKSISINEIASYFGGEKKYIGNVLEPRETLADNLKARTILGWQPKVAISKEYVDGILNEEKIKI
jgi:UDP-glucose 4-epimerase